MCLQSFQQTEEVYFDKEWEHGKTYYSELQQEDPPFEDSPVLIGQSVSYSYELVLVPKKYMQYINFNILFIKQTFLHTDT